MTGKPYEQFAFRACGEGGLARFYGDSAEKYRTEFAEEVGSKVGFAHGASSAEYDYVCARQRVAHRFLQRGIVVAYESRTGDGSYFR